MDAARRFLTRPSAGDPELRRIRQYEATQREICATAGARFDPPDYEKLVALAPSAASGHLPVRGSRHVGDTVEWSILADDEPMPRTDQLVFEHLHHVATVREDLVMYLALPIGWSFAVMNDGLRTWAAFSPSDHLAADVAKFLSTRNARDAALIRGTLDESFSDIDAACRLSRSLIGYLDNGREPTDFADQLRGIAGLVRGTAGDRRAGGSAT